MIPEYMKNLPEARKPIHWEKVAGMAFYIIIIPLNIYFWSHVIHKLINL